MFNLTRLRIYQGASPASPLFLDYDNSILTRFRFISYLRHLIVRLGLDENAYGGYSFRIEAATSAGSALKVILFKPWEGGNQIVMSGISERLLTVCTKPS